MRRVIAIAVTLALAFPILTSIPVGSASTSNLAPIPIIHGFKPLGDAPQDLPIIATLALPLRNVACSIHS